MEEGADTVDRISELPEHIIHQILSFLPCPKDGIRTSVLSKKWRSIWSSSFSFNFDQKSFSAKRADTQTENFKNYVDDELANRLEAMPSLLKFRLHLIYFNFKLTPHMNRWLTAAINKDVKDLEIHVDVKKRRRYILPQTILTSKTLTSLKLHGCLVDNLSNLNLPNLKELSIKEARVDGNVLESFICFCPLIEDLRLVHCSGLENLHISTLLKLNRIEVHECHGLKGVKIVLPSLQTFWYHGKRTIGQCKINLEGCENLKYLTLKDTFMTDELFQDQISKFPVLEKLVLHECSILKRITIMSDKLKGLALIRCKKLVESNIDAPNLVSFAYTGNKIPFSSMCNVAGLHEVKLYFESVQKDLSHLLLEMPKFLQKFDKCNGWKLVVCSNKNVTIYEDLGDIQLASFGDLKLELTKSSATLEDLVDSLLTASHPPSLSIVSSSCSKLLKSINKKVRNREENPSCCRYYSRKCWRHFLEDVKIEAPEEAKNEETPALNPSSSSSPILQTFIKLQWKC